MTGLYIIIILEIILIITQIRVIIFFEGYKITRFVNFIREMFEKPEEMTQAEYDELKANNWIKKWIKKCLTKVKHFDIIKVEKGKRGKQNERLQSN